MDYLKKIVSSVSKGDSGNNVMKNEEFVKKQLEELMIDKRILYVLTSSIHNKIVYSGEVITDSRFKRYIKEEYSKCVICDHLNPIHNRYYSWKLSVILCHSNPPVYLNYIKRKKWCYIYDVRSGFPENIWRTFGQVPSYDKENMFFTTLNTLEKTYITKNESLNKQVEDLFLSWKDIPVLNEKQINSFALKYNLNITKDNMENEENIVAEFVHKGGGIKIYGCYDSCTGTGIDIPLICTLSYDENKLKEIGKEINRKFYMLGEEFYNRVKNSDAIDELLDLSESWYDGYNDNPYPGGTYAIDVCKSGVGKKLFSKIDYSDLDSLSQMIGMAFAVLGRKNNLGEEDFKRGLSLEEYDITVDRNSSIHPNIYGQKRIQICFVKNTNREKSNADVEFSKLLKERFGNKEKENRNNKRREW